MRREHPKLHVTLCACADLPKMDFYGSCDAYVKVFVGGAAPDFTYHSLRVMGTIDTATGDMAWHLEPLAGEGGEDIGWCEVMATCTGESCEAASLVGHDALRRYKLGLGYLLGYSDAGPARSEEHTSELQSP